ncbi:MAG: hypothetical protein AAF449_15830 [Myxococcota bacterium]
MTSQLKGFLQKTSTDPKFAEAYKQNPQAVAKEFGLSDEERQALGDGDIEKLKELLDNDPGDVYFVIFENRRVDEPTAAEVAGEPLSDSSSSDDEGGE